MGDIVPCCQNYGSPKTFHRSYFFIGGYKGLYKKWASKMGSSWLKEEEFFGLVGQTRTSTVAEDSAAHRVAMKLREIKCEAQEWIK